jgi:hypothetical protein
MDEGQWDPLKHFEQWSLEALPPIAKNEIKSGLLNAYVEVSLGMEIPRPAAVFFTESRQRAYRYVSLAFDVIAKGLFTAGVLTEQLMSSGIPEMVSDALISSGLTRGPSGPLGLSSDLTFGDRPFGHYQVSGHHIKAMQELIHPRTCYWRAQLLAAPQLVSGALKQLTGRPVEATFDGGKLKELRGDIAQTIFAHRCKISVDTLQRAEREGRASHRTTRKINAYLNRLGRDKL